MPVQTQILHRRGTAATWTSTNPTLGAGEIGFETDTGKFKFGDGSTAWASLAYYPTLGANTFTGAQTATRFIVTGSTVATNGIYLPAANTLGLSTDSAERMRITSGGLLGIGGTPSGAMVQIFNNTAANVGLIVRGAASQTGDLLQIQNSAGTELFTIDSAGKVGIGNASPTYTLDVSSTARVGGSAPNSGSALLAYGTILNFTNINWNYGNIELVRNATNTSSPRFIGMPLDGDSLTATTIGAYNSIWGIYDSSPTTGSTSSALNAVMVYGAYAGHRWYTNGTERMRIDSSGNVGIGISPSYKLDIALSGNDVYPLRIINTNTASVTTKVVNMLFGGTDTVGGQKAAVILRAIPEDVNFVNASFAIFTRNSDTNTERMRIDSSGNVGIGTTSPTAKLDVDGSVRGTNLLLANPIINGGFDFYQRSATPTTGITTVGGYEYTLDRWISRTAAGGGSMVTTRQTTSDTTNLPFVQYCVRSRRSTGNTNTSGLQIMQALETANSIPFVGRQVTLSFYARKSTGFTGTFDAVLASGTGTDQQLVVGFTGLTTVASVAPTLSTTWTRYTATGTVSSSATQIGVYFSHAPSGTAGSDDYYEVTGVQIDLGNAALPFRRSGGTLAGEYAAACRYYYRQTENPSWIGNGFCNGTTLADIQVFLPVLMRTSPSITFANGTNFFGINFGSSSVNTNTVSNIYDAAPRSFYARFTTTGLTNGFGAAIKIQNASAYWEASAEL